MGDRTVGGRRAGVGAVNGSGAADLDGVADIEGAAQTGGSTGTDSAAETVPAETDGAETDGAETDGPGRRSRRQSIAHQFERLTVAIRNSDDDTVESVIIDLSRRRRYLAPLALAVGAFAMLFQGVKLLFTNWRLTLIQILPAMWIWAAMLNLKMHVFRGKSFTVVKGPVLIPIVLAIAAITAASFYLNAVFAFAISKPGRPEIRPAFADARRHRWPVLGWGALIGVALGFAVAVVDRWGKGWYALTLSIVVAVMMFAYVAIPSRLLGVTPRRSTRDKLTASAVGGAIGAMVCSPPYALGRLGIIMLGSHTFRVLAVVMIAFAVVLQTGATTAVKAVKMSAKLLVGQAPEAEAPAASDQS